MIIIILAALVIAVTYVFALKNDIRKIVRDLDWITGNDTNKKLTTETFDKEISKLIIGINRFFEKEKATKVAANRISNETRQMVSNVSHDFRTPLTSTIGYLQLLSDESVSETKKEEYIAIIEARLKELAKMIDSFFELTKISESGEIKRDEYVNLSILLEDTIFLYYEELKEKGLTPIININQDIHFYSNSSALKRIFTNIISNALQHGVEEFSAFVSQDKEIKLVFRNKTNSNEKIETDQIFDRFYTIDFSRSSKNTGLGLAIVKQLVSSLNGSVMAEHDGCYLTITIQFETDA